MKAQVFWVGAENFGIFCFFKPVKQQQMRLAVNFQVVKMLIFTL